METPVIGKNLLAQAISELYSFLKTSSHYEKLEFILRSLDIKAELDVVQALLIDLPSNIECTAVRVASEQVKETVSEIHKKIIAIHEELEYHKSRYLNSWRSPKYEQDVETLKSLCGTLRIRRELLISVLGVQGNIQIKIPQFQPNSSPHTPPVKKNFLDRLMETTF